MIDLLLKPIAWVMLLFKNREPEIEPRKKGIHYHWDGEQLKESDYLELHCRQYRIQTTSDYFPKYISWGGITQCLDKIEDEWIFKREVEKELQALIRPRYVREYKTVDTWDLNRKVL